MSSHPFVDPAALLRFLEDLRRAGYRIGTEKISAAHDIVVMLAARGKDARKPDELCRMLRPLLCTTPAEQAEFNGRFQQWVGQLFPVAGADQPAPDPEPEAVRATPERSLSEELSSLGRRSRRISWLAAGAVAVLLGTAWWLGRPGPLGHIHFDVMPEDAVIELVRPVGVSSGELEQGDSAFIVRGEWPDVPRGTYVFAVARPGYRPDTISIEVSGDTLHHVRVELTPIVVGAVTVNTTPAGARVELTATTPAAGGFADGRRTGTTPAAWSDVPVGEWRYGILLEGHRALGGTIDVDSSGTTEVTHALEPLPTGRLVVTTDAAGATIELADGTAVRPGEPLELHEGIHQLTVTAPGYLDEPVSIEIEADATLSRRIELTPRQPGVLHVRSDPPGGSVLLRSADEAATLPDSLLPEPTVREVLEGRYSVRVELEGYEPFVLDTVVAEGDTTRVDAELRLVRRPRFRVGFNPGGDTIAAGDPSNAVMLWNPTSREPGQLLPGSGLRVARGAYRAGEAGRWDELLGPQARFVLEDGLPVMRDMPPITALAFSHDGRTLAAASDVLTIVSLDGGSVDDVRLVDEYSTPAGTGVSPHEELIFGMRFAENGDTISGVTRDGSAVLVVRCEEGTAPRPDCWERRPAAGGPDRAITAGTATRDGSGFASAADGEIHIEWRAPVIDSLAAATVEPRSTVVLWNEGAFRAQPVRGVVDVALPDSSWLAFLDSAGTLHLGRLSFSDSSRHQFMPGATLNATRLVGDPIGGIVIAGTRDGRILPLPIDGPVGEIPSARHRGAVMRLALSPDGRYLASAAGDGPIHLTDLHLERRIAAIEIGHAAAEPVSPHRCPAAQSSIRSIATVCASGTYDEIARPEPVLVEPLAVNAATPGRDSTSGDTPAAAAFEVTALAFSPDGNSLAAATSDGALRIRDLRLANRPAWHQALLQNVAFSPDSGRLAVPGVVGTVEIWDTRMRERREIITGHDAAVSGVAFSTDGRWLATGDESGLVRLWSRHPQRRLWSDTEPARHLTAFVPSPSTDAGGIVFSPDGTLLASRGEEREVLLWDVVSGQRKQMLEASFTPVSFAFDAAGTRLAVGGAGGEVGVWAVGGRAGVGGSSYPASPADTGASAVRSDSRLVAGPIQAGSSRVRALRWVSDATLFVMTDDSVSGGLVVLSESGTQVVPRPAFAGNARAAVDSTMLDAFITIDPEIMTQAMVAFERSLDVPWLFVRDSAGVPFEVARHAERTPADTITWETAVLARDGDVTAASLSRDASRLAVATAGHAIRLVDVATNRMPMDSLTGHRRLIHDLAFGPDGTLLASASADSTIRIWDLSQGASPGTPLRGHDGVVRSVAFRADGRMLASIGDDGRIILWDLGVGIPLRLHDREITSLSFSPDGTRLASAGIDGRLVIWDLGTLQPFDSVNAEQPIESVAFSPDGRLLATTTADSVLRVWDARGSQMATVTEWVVSDARWIGLLLLVGIALPFALRRILLRREAAAMLMRHGSDEPPRLHHVTLPEASERLFVDLPMREAARRMRQRFVVPSDQLEVAATVDRTVQAGGIFTPVFGSRQERPEYVAMVDRSALGDQQTALIDEMLDRLVHDDVPIARYYIDGDIRLCHPRSRRDRPLTLGALVQRHPGCRLLLFGDVGMLFDPLTGKRAEWTDELHAWQRRAVLTPEPQPWWTRREYSLEADFLVHTASPGGLLRVSDGDTTGTRDTTGSRTGRFPPMLRERPRRWIERDRPPAPDVERMIESVRRYLDDSGFLWLCACAVYPALSWKLTTNLGVVLHDDGGRPLMDAERLAALARLPWFRYGYMPDWMRVRLLDELRDEREQEIRTALATLLIAAVEGRDDVYDLEIARHETRTLHALVRPLLSRLRKNTQAGNAARDYVFYEFMSGRRTEPLGLRLPRAFRLLIDRGSSNSLSRRAVADARRLQLAAAGSIAAATLLVIGCAAAWERIPETMVRLGQPMAVDSLGPSAVLLAAQSSPSGSSARSALPLDPAPSPGTIAFDAASTNLDWTRFLEAYLAGFEEASLSEIAPLEQVFGFVRDDPALPDVRTRAYVLATIRNETAGRWTPVESSPSDAPDRAAEPAAGTTQPGTDEARYQARGYVPISGRNMYEELSRLLGLGPEESLTVNPDRAMIPEVAYRIASTGMTEGAFTGRKLADFINADGADYRGARLVIADDGRDAAGIADDARRFETILTASIVVITSESMARADTTASTGASPGPAVNEPAVDLAARVTGVLTQLGVASQDAEQYAADLYDLMARWEINTQLRQAHFLAQVLHESGSLRYDMENLNYSSDALRRVFAPYFPTKEEADAYARQPERIANRVYANRMGNGDETSGDGWRYRGRGLLQVTGRNNYQALADWLGDQAVMDNPDLVVTRYAAHTAIFYWATSNLNSLADQDDIVAITRRFNGGLNGLSHRRELYNRLMLLLPASGLLQ